MSVGSPLKIGKVMTRQPDMIMINNFDCSSFNESWIDNNHLINLFPVDSTEDQKKNVIENPYYKNIQTVFVLCDTGHDGEYNEREENPLIDYTRNNGEVGMINKIDEILQTLGSNHGGVFRLDNFPKNQEGIKKLETNLIKNMCTNLNLPEVTDKIIEHTGLYDLIYKQRQIDNDNGINTFVVETFRKNDNEIINENDTSLQRYSISNQFDCRISKIPPIDDFQITLENCILPNPFPKACSFLFNISNTNNVELRDIINTNNVKLRDIINKTTKIDFNKYDDLIGKINGLIDKIKKENKTHKSGLVIIHIFNNTVGVQFGQVTANQVSSYVWGYNKRNGGNKDSKNIFTSMVISDRDKNENERHCIATMGKQMGDLITIHALNTDPQKKILNRALLTLDRFCAILNVSMFGSSVFQSPKKIGQQDSTSVLSYIFKKNENILELFKNNFVQFIQGCKEKNLKDYITDKINYYGNNYEQNKNQPYKIWLIKLINNQKIDDHVVLINKKIEDLNKLCKFLKNSISINEADQNNLKMLIESFRYIDTIDKFIEKEKIELIMNETNVKVDNIFTNITRLSLYITGYSNRAPLQEKEDKDNLIQAFGLILGQISDFSNFLLTYSPYHESVIITNLFISYTIMINTKRKMKQFLIYTLKNITETIQNISGEDIQDYFNFINLSLSVQNNFDIIYNSVAENIINDTQDDYCTKLNQRLNSVLVYMRNNNPSPMFETNYAILRYLLRSIIFQKEITNENRIELDNISNITYDKVLNDYERMEKIYTNDIITTPGKYEKVKSSYATNLAQASSNNEISFFGLVPIDFSYILNFINDCGGYIVKNTNEVISNINDIGEEAITNINDIISNFTDIGVDPTGLLFDRNTGDNITINGNNERMDIINDTPYINYETQNSLKRRTSDGINLGTELGTDLGTTNEIVEKKMAIESVRELRPRDSSGNVVVRKKGGKKSSKKPAVTRRKNKKTFKRKTMKKRKMPKRKNKTRRLRQDK